MCKTPTDEVDTCEQRTQSLPPFGRVVQVRPRKEVSEAQRAMEKERQLWLGQMSQKEELDLSVEGVMRLQTAAQGLLDNAQKLLAGAVKALEPVTAVAAEKMIKTATKAEPKVTKTLLLLSGKHGFDLIGLEDKLKTKGSLKDKLARDMVEEGKPLETVAENVSDVLRYTAQFPPEALVAGTEKVLRDLEKERFTIRRLKNTWLGERPPYKGINVQLATLDGQKMELQIHTADSLWLKGKGTHDIYEMMRDPSISKELKKELDTIQINMAKLLPKPPGIDKVKNI
jgi:hypothetical protein